MRRGIAYSIYFPFKCSAKVTCAAIVEYNIMKSYVARVCITL